MQSGYVAIEGPPRSASVVIAAPICAEYGTSPIAALAVSARIPRLGSEGVRQIGNLLAREARGIEISGSLYTESLDLEDQLLRTEPL